MTKNEELKKFFFFFACPLRYAESLLTEARTYVKSVDFQQQILPYY